jgi:SET domain-containing protein
MKKNSNILNNNPIEMKKFFRSLDLIYCPYLFFDTKDYHIRNRIFNIAENNINIIEKSELYSDKINYQGDKNKKHPILSIKFISDDIGYGLFAEQNFEKNDYVSEFCGKVTINYDKQSQGYNYNYFGDDSEIVIAPRKIGNESQFVNHSYDPNVEWTTIIGTDKKYHVLFVANKDIQKGEQILVNYGEEYWKNIGYDAIAIN